MAEPRLVIFDWDGTLVDSVGLIVSSMQQAATLVGVPVAEERSVRSIIGLELGEAIASLYPAGDQSQWDALRSAYVDAYLAMDMASHQFFPGMAGLLDELVSQGVQLSVATGKSRRGLDRAMKAMGVSDLFVSTICADETHGKPHPAMVLELCARTGAAVSVTPVVGDTRHDMEMAKRAGAPGVAVSWGAHDLREILVTHDVIPVECIEQLSSVLSKRG
jgi:phosphoglycolate phosphatase